MVWQHRALGENIAYEIKFKTADYLLLGDYDKIGQCRHVTG